jgi:AcrR family transcriptional regulator
VSPARARTSIAQIVAAGRDRLEAGGLDSVTMQAVGEQVGVRAPSLYKWVPSRAALIAAIGEAAFEELHEALAPFARDLDPAAGLRAMAGAFRSFALAHPRTYELLFMNLPADARPSGELNVLASAPLLELAERLVGSDRALDAARLVTAFAHGFVSMELSGAFRLGGDVDEAYRYGVRVLVDALATRQRTGTVSFDRSAPD